jgi:hypothetical protein
MREYAKISPRRWTGNTGRALRGHLEAQLVVDYLVTCQHANMLGVYYLPIAYLAVDTGLTQEGAWKGLRQAIEVGFCRYDEAAEVVWVLNMAREQVGDLDAKDNRCKGIQKEYDALPDNAFLGAFFDAYVDAFHMTARRGATPLRAPSEPLRSQEQEQEHEQEHEQEQPQDRPAAAARAGRSPVARSGAPRTPTADERAVLDALQRSETLAGLATLEYAHRLASQAAPGGRLDLDDVLQAIRQADAKEANRIAVGEPRRERGQLVGMVTGFVEHAQRGDAKAPREPARPVRRGAGGGTHQPGVGEALTDEDERIFQQKQALHRERDAAIAKGGST